MCVSSRHLILNRGDKSLRPALLEAHEVAALWLLLNRLLIPHGWLRFCEYIGLGHRARYIP